MEIPVEILERLALRCKRVAEPEVNLEQLKRESQGERRKWWEEIEANRAEYRSLPYDRDKFLESNFALARLKLVASFADRGEPMPPDHGFRQEELDVLHGLEEFIVYDRLSVEDIKEYIKSGQEDDRGIVKLARMAAVNGYDQMYRLMEERDIPNDLAFALQRVYQERIKKVEAAAAQIRLSEVHQSVEEAAEQKAVGLRAGVTAQEARLLEQNYIALVQSHLRNLQGAVRWQRIRTFDSVDKIRSELRALSPTAPEAAKQNMPLGRGMSAVVDRRRLLFFRKPSLLLGVRVLSGYRELHLRGLDAEISFGELTRHVERAIAQAKVCPFVLALASTAGWSQEAIDYAKEGVLPPDLSVVLIDLKKREMHHRLGDERLERVLPYLEVK
ncbi:MAG: hypothetical protein DRI39_04780 [Chloroflexi bacterium]|nr:MAG: hypothetical protein DRI39_04780 [Chloroflexota bacterium]